MPRYATGTEAEIGDRVLDLDTKRIGVVTDVGIDGVCYCTVLFDKHTVLFSTPQRFVRVA